MSEVFLRIYHSSAPAASPHLGGAAFMIDRLLILPTTIPELAADAVVVEPVSARNSLLAGKLTGNFVEIHPAP